MKKCDPVAIFLWITICWLFIWICLLFTLISYPNITLPEWVIGVGIFGTLIWGLYGLCIAMGAGGVYGEALDNVSKERTKQKKQDKLSKK